MKNFKLNFLHVCDYASFDQMGKLNILGVFENVNSVKFPYQHPQFFVVANVLIFKSGEYECVIRVIDQDSIELGKFILPKVNMTLVKGQPEVKLGVVGQFNSIKFEKPGKYKIEIVIDGDIVDSKEISAHQVINKNAQQK